MNKQRRERLDIRKIIYEAIDDKMKDMLRNVNNNIETKIRYYLDQRLGLLMNNDRLLTRNTSSFTISPDSTHGGNSFMFKFNGNTVALITQEGYLYCKNILVNGINVLDVINRVFKQFDQDGSIYVKHEQLKDGTYMLNIEDIITKTETITDTLTIDSSNETPLIVNIDDNNRYVKMKLGEQNIIYDKYESSISINNLLNILDWGNSNQTMLYSFSHLNYFLHNNPSIIIGKEDIIGDSVNIDFNYTNANDINNNLSLAFWDYDPIIKLYRNSINTNVQNVNMFNLNNDMTLKIGSNDAQARCFYIYYDYLYNTSDCYASLGLQGHPGLKFYVDRLQALLPLTIDTINANYISANKASLFEIENVSNIFFYDLEDMIIDFKKHYAFYNDRARIIYTTSGTYNNTLSLDINKSHSIICRVYSDGGGSGNTDYFTTIKHVITLLDGDGKTTLKDLVATNGAFTTSLTLNGNSVLTDDSNYAKLNANNVFTGTTNTFKSASFLTNYIEELFSNLSAGSETIFTFGKSTGLYQAGNLVYHLDSTLSNSYISINLNGISGFRIYADKTESIPPLYVPSLYINNNLLDVNNIAYKNIINTFTKKQIIDTVDSYGLQLMNSAINNGQEIHLMLGKETGYVGNLGFLTFHYDSDKSLANNYIALGMAYYTQDYQNALRVYYNKIVMKQPLTAPKYETTNNTAATAIGSNLTNAINELIDAKAGNVFHHEIKDEQKGMNNCFMPFEARDTMPGYSVCYSDELKLFVGTCYNQSYAYYSNDGMDWKRVSSPSSPIMCVCYGDYGFITCPYNGTTVLHSNDGITWESYGSRLVNITSGWTCVNWCYDVYIAIGKSTRYFCLSVDGYDWYQQDFGLSTTWNCVCYGNNIGFVAVGNSGNYAYAPLGMGSWATGTLPNTYNFNSVVYGKNGFVAVGNGLYGAISTNGTNWNQITMPDNKNWISITYGVGRYIAIPSSGSKAAVSFNGTTWTTYNLPSNYWKQITYGNGIFTAVSDGAYTYATYISNRTFLSARSILSMIYPVGAIYESRNSTSPAT